MRKIIDTHLHLDDKISQDLKVVVNTLDQNLIACNVSRGIVLHLLIQKWSYKEVGELTMNSQTLKAFQNVNPFLETKYKELEDGVKNFGYVGLKLHPRSQKFKLDDPCIVDICRYAGELSTPVLIDAFPDGNAIMEGFNVIDFSTLAIACPDTNFIWAHFGGHFVIDFMMVAKRLPNVYLDLSYSWLYYRGSSVVQDLAYAVKSMRYSKIFYGSDYPDRTIANSINLCLESFANFGIDGKDLDKLLFTNARDFFGWNDL